MARFGKSSRRPWKKKPCGRGRTRWDLYSVRNMSDTMLITGRIGVKPLVSNALLMAQKKNGQAAEINEASLKHFPPSEAQASSSRRRSVSPSKDSTSSGGKGKGKASAKNSDDEEDEDSGDEAEKLDEAQMNEIDTIYRK